MASALAIVSKAVFEKQAPGADVGTVVALDRYAATPKQLEPLADGGALFLVTVRPPDETLWLVAVLESPVKKDGGWRAPQNVVAIRDISALRGKLVFETGKGLPSEEGKLAMSLQTARVLTDADVLLLRQDVKAGASTAKRTPAPAATKHSTAAPARNKKSGSSAGSGSKSETGSGSKSGSKSGSEAGADPASAIQTAIAAKDPATALGSALTWWRATRSPEVADLVDAVAAKLEVIALSDQPAWTKHAMSRDPRLVGSLIASLPAMAASFLPTAADLLGKFPDDPRLARATAELAQDPITTASSNYGFWVKSIDALIRIGDVGVIPALKARVRKKPGDSQFWPKFYAALKKAIAKLEAIEPVAVDAKRVAKLATAAASLSTQPIAAAPVTGGTKREPGRPLLDDALAHLTAGRLADAIAAMVERWREVRAPALADAIDRASRQLPSYDRPITGEAWETLFERDANATMPQLLLNLHGGTIKDAELRIAALATLPDDPRISLRLAAFCHGRHAGPERTQYWRAIYDLLARHRDHRTVLPLIAEHGEFQGTYYDNHRQAARIIGPFCRAPGDPPVLDRADATALAKLEAAVAKLEAAQTDEAALLDAIAAEWKADAPRLVYADWLQEREHPRGELLALSVREGKRTTAEAKRFGALLRTPYLHGEFTDVASYAQQTFDRGLWRELHSDYRAGTLLVRACAVHPLARLVTELAFDREPPTMADVRLFAANAPRLRKITFEQQTEPLDVPGFVAKQKTLVRA